MKKVAIIDDESAGRHLIKEYLAAFPDLVVICEANNGVDAVRRLNEFKPDLVFLDIQMPGLSGFEVLAHLEEIPQIIFSTAYDKYALNAFEVHAVDYLLKPYTLERFRKAMQKIEHPNSQANIRPLAESLIMEQQAYPERILVQSGKKLVTISVNGIIRIEAYGDYSKLITEAEVFLSNFGISALEAKLNATYFIRVHRSSIINLRFVKEVNRYGHSFDVVMRNGDVVRVSRGYQGNLKKLIY